MSTVQLPRLGLGCASLGNLFRERSEAEADAILESAWDAGIRYFDTAPHYGLGLSERRLGRFLSGKPRDEYAVSTKVGRLLRPNPDWDGGARDGERFDVPATLRRVWDFSDAGIRASLEQSLERLGLDKVEIVLLHDPERSGLRGAVDGGMVALDSLRGEGLATWIGCGSMSPETLTATANTGLADLLMVANRYTLLDQTVAPEVLAACDRTGTKILAAAVFNSGLLAVGTKGQATYDYATVPDEVIERAHQIERLCAEFGVELPTAALQYPLLDPRVSAVVVGADAPEHVVSNVHRLDESVPDRLWRSLAQSGLVPRCA